MESVWKHPENKSAYVLRYFLPRTPYVSKEVTVQRLEELISFCRRSHADAVQFYVNLLSNWCYMPDTLEHTLEWVNDMKEMIPEIRRAGISYQLNFQAMLGHHTGGVDFKKDYRWNYLVDHKGNENPGCACPIDIDFRDIMGCQLKAWASTRPDVIWIDDDFRLHNHGLAETGMDWYCYCPRHIELFSERYGKKITREELVSKIIEAGRPTRDRLLWLDFLNETMKETASWIEEVVHKVSPHTRIAQMTSLPDVHAVEGRNWGDFLMHLSGEGFCPIIRPNYGPYTDYTPINFIGSYTTLDQTMANIKMQYPGEVDAYPELENTRFTRWAKSGAATRFQLRLGQLLGCPGITLSLYDLEGTPLSEEPFYEKILTNEKCVLDQLAELGLNSWMRRGVGLLTDPDLARKVQVENSKDISSLLGTGRTWDNVLLQMGVPACYFSPQQAFNTGVVALDGGTAWLPDDKEMEQLLSHGVLLDSKAAEVLIRRGYGAEIGVDVGALNLYQTSAEIFHHFILEEMPQKRMPMRLGNGKWSELILKKGASEVTTLIDPKGITHPGTVIFENSFGGRVAVYAGSVDLGSEFFNHTRVLWTTALVNWLSRRNFPLCVQAPQRILSFRRDSNGRILLAFANFAADVLEEMEGRLRDAGEIRSVSCLSDKGEWVKADMFSFEQIVKGEYKFTISAKLQLYDWVILLVETDEKNN